ncbi:MAG: NAD(P)-dependent oxidoreductase [Pikeienuella sp.]
MNILVLGATGAVGQACVAEARRRGHKVTAASRSGGRRLDVLRDTDRLDALIAGHDVTLSALRPAEGDEDALVAMTGAVLTAARRAARRAYVTGGAGPLFLADESGHTVLTAPGFLPDNVRPIAEACGRQDALLDEFADTDWICLRPAALLINEKRTGRYALGRDRLVTQADGTSRISHADFAVAMLDLVELAPRPRQRLTVGW